jgi:methylmalonyl-CoA mutase, N-terminal domain
MNPTAGTETLQDALESWARLHDKEFHTETKTRFVTDEGLEVQRVYTPLDLEAKGFDYLRDLSLPGEYPFTRSITPTLYRSGLWRISQYSGYATPLECNALWKAQVQSGLNTIFIAYDLPTQLGYDPDRDEARGEVGRVGASLVSLRDWEVAFDGIDIDQAIISQVLNAPAAIGIAMHLAYARRRGVQWHNLKGVMQNDVLKEYSARGNYIFPPEPALRLVVDSLAFCADNVPNYHPMTVCSYHYSEQGADRVSEIAFALADAIAYLEAARARGVDLDRICPHLMWLTSHQHYRFFDEIAKLRALRKLWATITKERFGLTNPESMRCKIYSAESGTSLCKEQPLNNIARIAIATLAAALAGVQIIDLRTYDEQWGIPSKEAELLGVRIQQIVGYETGIADTVDPLGGAYYLESLVADLERLIKEELDHIDRLGGMLRAIELGYPQRKSIDHACQFQKQVEDTHIVRVGHNRFREREDTNGVHVYRAAPQVEEIRVRDVTELRRTRDAAAVEKALDAICAAAAKSPAQSGNLMPYLIEAVEAYATSGEICTALRQVWGEFKEPALL